MRKIENTTGMPVNLIIDELKSDDIRKRIHSVKNLSLIASTIGPDRTKNELIPFVQDLLDDEDEVLIALVESLSDGFNEFLNGQVLVLLPTFEQLCKVEESGVREKVIKTLNKAAIQIRKSLSGMSDMKKVEEVGMGIVRRLNENDYYMAKSAVASIVPVLFGMVSPQSQSELLTIYGKMCAEQIPSVRKYASIQLQHLVKQYPTVNDNFIQAQLSTLIKDEQDFIRMFVVDSLVAISKTQFHQKNPNFALNLFKTLAEDASWRVRFYFCDKLSEISESLGKETYRKNFQPYHLKFLQDPEPEMKSIATQKIEKVYTTMETEDILTKFLPILKVISSDQNAFVRNSLAQSVLVLCGPIGKKSTSEMILPIFLTLLKDSDSEVRITLFKKLSLITQVLGVDALSQSVIPALTELAQDKNWRIRSSTIEVLSFFAKAIGPEFLSDKVLKLLLDWMSDKVFSVRQAAVQSTSQLISILGAQWAERNLLQKIWQFQQINNYLHRLTVLFTINQISSLMSNDYLVKIILPILQTMSKDSVANVRINVCKTITNTQQYYKDRESLKKILQAMNDDLDQEVKYQARAALE